jgi:hypothetical protein
VRVFSGVRVIHLISFLCSMFVCLCLVSCVHNVASFLWIVHSSLPLQFSLDCPFFVAPSVFSRLSILHWPFSFLWIVHSSLPLQFSLTFLYYRTKCVFEVLVIYLINYNKPIPPWCLSVNATSSPSCLLRNIGTNKTSIKKSPALKGHCCVLSNLF